MRANYYNSQPFVLYYFEYVALAKVIHLTKQRSNKPGREINMLTI